MFKRALIAAAVAAAASSSAFAGSSVEVYSEAWLNMYDGKHAFQTDTALIFAGDQKLDNGLTAFGVIRAAVGDGYEAGANTFGVQRMEIGVRGDFGSIKFGKIRDVHIENIDWYLAGSGQIVGNIVEAGTLSNGYAHGVRYDGSFGGVTVGLSYAERFAQWSNGGHSDDSGLFSGVAAYDFGAGWVRGSFATGKVYNIASSDKVVVTAGAPAVEAGVARDANGAKGTSFALGAGTKFGPVALDVAYFNNQFDNFKGTSEIMDQDGYKVGLGYSAGAFSINGYWAHQGDNKSVAGEQDYDTIGVKAVYNVGKSLNVYARYLKDTNIGSGLTDPGYKEGAIRFGSTFAW